MEKVTVVAGIVPLARGENLKLFLLDSGIEFDYIRVPLDDTWKIKKAEVMKKGYYIGSLPYIEVEGKIFGRAVPILRYLSTKLGKYLGSTPEENQYIDAMADISDDWFQSMKNAFFESKEALELYRKVERPVWLSIYEKYYSDIEDGPYALGENITYIDILVYHMFELEEVKHSLSSYPHLKKLVTAFEERPNIKAYLVSIEHNE